MRRLWLAVVCLTACGDDGPVALGELDGVTVLSREPWPGGRTRIVATIVQPVDHQDPEAASFSQRLVIYEQDAFSPTVIDSEGYAIGDGFGISEPTSLLAGNEVEVEHRFFGDSMPTPLDWSKLDLAQAAADHHHVIETLRAHYRGPWISTGSSKGGVAALAHRRFYPDDVSGTVAYVAPRAIGLSDQRFSAYIGALGESTCGAALLSFQHAVLTEPRRGQLAASVSALLASSSLHDQVLGADRILELTTLETPFTFWQYGSQQRCASIPDVGQSTDAAVLAFIDSTNFFRLWSDEAIATDQGYWYAVATEQGYPADDLAGLEDVVRYSDVPTPLQLVTEVAAPSYDPAVMQDVADWVASEARAVVLIYGTSDPWTAGALEVSGNDDTSRHFVAGGNHFSRLLDLPAGEHDSVARRLEGWADAAR